MFKIKIADIVVGINHKYQYVRRLCRDYETEEENCAFCVSATDEEIQTEQKGEKNFPAGYCESLCVYRKLCLKMIEYDAFLMHSAVIAADGLAYVFAARSGVGKTTHIRLWQKELGSRTQVVNGDKPIFRFRDGILYACGTPWQGKEGMGCNIMLPVQGLCFLERNSENHIRRLSMSEVADRIFHQLLIPEEEEKLDHFMALVEKMITETNCWLLQCNQNQEAAQLAYQTMRRK